MARSITFSVIVSMGSSDIAEALRSLQLDPFSILAVKLKSAPVSLLIADRPKEFPIASIPALLLRVPAPSTPRSRHKLHIFWIISPVARGDKLAVARSNAGVRFS